MEIAEGTGKTLSWQWGHMQPEHFATIDSWFALELSGNVPNT